MKMGEWEKKRAEEKAQAGEQRLSLADVMAALDKLTPPKSRTE